MCCLCMQPNRTADGLDVIDVGVLVQAANVDLVRVLFPTPNFDMRVFLIYLPFARMITCNRMTSTSMEKPTERRGQS
jgi:hypothetical protein